MATSAASNGGARANEPPAPRAAPTPLGPTVASDLAPAFGRIARVLHDKRNVATAIIYELWHQHLVSGAYFITDPRAFKGQYVYMCTCVSPAHLDWCLNNSVTLLGDAQYETFRHDPVQGVNTFFLSGAMGVTDANMRIKPGLAGLLRIKASALNFYKASDLVSKNVVVLRAETPDDACMGQAMRHYGVPEQALRALRGLVENWKHGVARGRYETAFGATDPFPILRGFLQGAQGSPEACKIMMDTIAQALELKVSGYTAFAPDGAGGEMGTLIFVDDAANATGDAFFLHRVTLFWSIWSRITDCQLNIKGNNKTVVQSLEYKRGKDGTLIPVETRQRFYISAVVAGDLPRRIPNLPVTEHYLYCGMATRMDGRHNEIGLSTLRSKLAACGAQATTAPTSRRLALRKGTSAGREHHLCIGATRRQPPLSERKT